MNSNLTDRIKHSPLRQLATGVLIHGCHLKAAGWSDIMWGTGPENMGRLPQGILAACELNAECVVIGSGASSRVFEDQRSQRCGELLTEAEYGIETLRCQFHQLQDFRTWQAEFGGMSPTEWQRLKSSILQSIVSDVTSQSTVDELRYAGQVFADRGIQRVVLVSSPTHLPRVLRDAATLYQNDTAFSDFSDRILAVPSRTCYVGSTAADVMVLEPPHRPDRDAQKTNSLRQLAQFDAEDETGLVAILSEISSIASNRNSTPTA